MSTYRILCGDVREKLAEIESGSVQTCVTSPPYFGLRDYGHAGQIGLEATPEAFVQAIVSVFAEVGRVLRDDGTAWINLGSSYAGSGPTTGGCSPKSTLTGGGGRYRAGSKAEAMFDASRDTDPIPSLLPQRDRAYGSDGRGLQGWTDADSACSDLCDECLGDFLSHRDRIVGTGQRIGQSSQLHAPTSRDSGPADCASASLGVSPLDVPASTTIESWRQHRAACSRCDSRASALSGVHSSTDGALAFARMTWLDYTRRLKQKDLVPIPWMVAMALQAAGWYLRADVIWSKPNPMPESVTDRPTKAHEYVFLLSKSARYYYNADAIAEPASEAMQAQIEQGYSGLGLKDYESAGVQNPSSVKARIIANARKKGGGNFSRAYAEAQPGHGAMALERPAYLTRNIRSVWTINTQPYPGAHFATFPEELPTRCILAGSKPGDLVLDPFTGSGTTGAVALKLGRSFVGCELNPAYVELAKKRIGNAAPLFSEAV